MATVQASKTPQLAKLLSRSLRRWGEDELDKPVVLAPDMDLLKRIRAESPFVPKEGAGVHIDLKLTVAEQRRVVEAEVKQPCVRMWLTKGEHEHTYAHAPDFTHGQLEDGRFYCWRRKADLDELARSTSPADVALFKALTGRILRDDVQ